MPSSKLLFLHRVYINLARELARLPNFVFFVNKAAKLFLLRLFVNSVMYMYFSIARADAKVSEVELF
jgi:hypothetical protein